MVPSLIVGGFLFFFCLSKVGERLMRKIELEAACPHHPKIGAKYLVFFSPRSLKMREKYISFEVSFAQFVYFLKEVCLLFKF